MALMVTDRIANTETRLPCFDENLHIAWQKGRMTFATDRDIPEA